MSTDESESLPSPAAADGRQLRRIRNIDAVRRAILDLELERASITLEAIAARAGVTVRSIYRYHADLDAAIADARQHRVEEIYRVWDRWERPEPSACLDERIVAMIDHRFEMERLGRPLRNTIAPESPDPEFDRQVIELFTPELEQIDAADRPVVTAGLCFVLRPRGLRSIIEFPQHGDQDPRDVVELFVRRLLAAD